ncbi:unnamed protein product [Mycena citricolor]|uniref:NGG1p interacting factor 3 n=1 Tax=Mycena citricolor TaxID=2018698 RepID=A0AAD2HV35_9AGAR|nr:unnamed protein product [Mycena citricolor]
MATTVFTKSVTSAMQRIAPLVLAGSWDNVGLILESATASNSNKVLLTIDVTPAVCEEAISHNVSMIVSYHPPIFHALKSLTLSTPLQKTLLRCASAGISIYSPHSALDSVFDGMNDWLAKCIEADPQRVSCLDTKPSTAAIGGDGRRVTFDPPISMSVLEERIKKHLSLSQIQVGYSTIKPDRLVHTVAICAGSGGGMFQSLKTIADVYFTGEMQHDQVLAALGSGTHVILCGHTNTERGFLPILANRLTSELKTDATDVEVLVSQSDAHPLQMI